MRRFSFRALHISYAKYAMLSLMLLCIPVVNASEAKTSVRPKVGLVLSGGGAKGVAHIGVLKVLEEAGIPIDCICGTSMGAIIGGLYAIGYTAAELDSMVREQDWMFLLTDQIQRSYRSFDSKYDREHYLVNISLTDNQKLSTPSGLVKGQSILNKFTSLTIGYHQVKSFDDLPIPYACVALDLVGGKEIVIREGNLPLAMRTSMSVPGVFEPVYRDGMALIDGGVVNNFPVDVCKEMGADIIIGVDLSTVAFKKPDYKGLMEIANRITFLLGEEKYRKNKKEVDLYMNPELMGYTSADFRPEAIDTMIVMGERVARKHWSEIVQLKESIGGDTLCGTLNKRYIEKNNSYIDEIKFKGLETLDEKNIYRMLRINHDSKIRFSDAEGLSFTLQGLGLFDSVSYSIVDDGEGKHVLAFDVHEKNKGSIGVGAHLNTEDIASVLLHAEGTIGSGKKHNLSATAKINKNAWLNLDYNFRIKDMSRLGFAYNIAYADFKLRNHHKDMGYLSYLNNRIEMYIRNDSYRNLRYKFNIQYDWYNNVSNWYCADYSPYSGTDEHFVSTGIDMEYDQMDNREIPANGINIRLIPRIYMHGVFDENCSIAFPLAFRIKSAYSINDRICVLPELFGRFVIGDKSFPLLNNFIGGECYDRYVPGQLVFYGLHNTEILENIALGYRVDFRFRILKKHYISCIGNYIIHHDKVKGLFDGENFWGTGLKYSYDSLLGPVSATVDYSNRTKKVGFYASAGYYF